MAVVQTAFSTRTDSFYTSTYSYRQAPSSLLLMLLGLGTVLTILALGSSSMPQEGAGRFNGLSILPMNAAAIGKARRGWGTSVLGITRCWLDRFPEPKLLALGS